MTWKFDNNIANVFHIHARQHIPKYELVIQKTVDICKSYSKDSVIVDVGCAVGETLVQLHNNGFTNLYGIDNSQSMIDRCPQNLGFKLVVQDKFIEDVKFDVVIINWTLHFIENKIEYLKQVFDNLKDGGTLIITDKTSKQPLPLEHYHLYKKRQGVTDQQIKDKQQSVENIMFIDDVEWYLTIFKELGFRQSYIFEADWCFTSFVAIK